jgi:hypothetical protein
MNVLQHHVRMVAPVLTWWTVSDVFVHLVGKAMLASLVSRIHFKLDNMLNVCNMYISIFPSMVGVLLSQNLLIMFSFVVFICIPACVKLL